MGAEDAVGGLVAEDLDQAVRVVVGLGAAVGGEGELAHLELDAERLEVLLGLADPGHLGVRVDDGRHTVVVDVHRRARHALHADDALVLGLVGQHRTQHAVADRVDAVSPPSRPTSFQFHSYVTVLVPLFTSCSSVKL